MNTNTSPGTGAIVAKPGKVIEWKLSEGITLANGGAAIIRKGQVVRITGNNTVDTKTAVGHIGVGIALTDIAIGDNGSVLPTIGAAEVSGTAKGGTLAAGAIVRADGTLDANNIPNYIAAATGSYADGIVLSGGAAGSTIKVLLFNSIFVAP